MVSSTRRARNKVMVLTNSVGGPRVLHEDETVDLSALETADGKSPNFRMMSPKAAAKYLDKHERGTPRPFAELIIDKENIQSTHFLRLVHESDGHLPPFHEDRWYAEIEQKIRDHGGGALTQEEIDRLDREGWEAKVEITVDRSAERAEELKRDIIRFNKRLFGNDIDFVTDPSLRDLKHDRFMLSEIIEKVDSKKPITPAQQAYLKDVFDTYARAGRPVAPEVRDYLETYPVQGEGQLYKWPTLADEMIHTPPQGKQLLTGQTIKRLNNTLAQSDKLVLDNLAVQRIAEAFKAYPEQIAQNAQFVRPPFETCWIELPNRVWGRVLGLQTLDEGMDDRVGYLFIKDRVYVCFQGKGKPPLWSPIVYELNSVPNQLKLAKEFERIGGERDKLNLFYMGETLLKLAGEGVALSLRGQHGFTVLTGPNQQAIAQHLSRLNWGGFCGELPIIISILLAINTPSQQVIQYTDIPKRWRTTHKGKKAIHAHRIVTIDLDRAPGVRLISREADDEREKRHVGWHTVRGHFVHDRRYREVRAKGLCDHGAGGEWWTEFAPGHWECLNCGAKRTWRTYPNGRGDKSKPVEHHYHVKG